MNLMGRVDTDRLDAAKLAITSALSKPWES